MTTALICFLTVIIILAVMLIRSHMKLKACEAALFQVALAVASHEIIKGCKIDIEGVEVHHYKE